MRVIQRIMIWMLAVAIAGIAGGQEASKKRPNILVIYADDLGYGDVRCYNPEKGKIKTPHMDRLASEGMRFTDGHSSSGVCSPSRYTLLTGRYHWRTRLKKGIVGLWEEPLIAPGRMTIGSLAKQKGYRTGCIGKWHLGWDWPIPEGMSGFFKGRPKKDAVASRAQRMAWRRVFGQPIGGGPITRGFDVYFGTDVPNWPPFCFIDQDRTVGIPDDYLPPAMFEKNQASRQGPAVEGWTLEPILPALGERAAQFIRESAARPEPFLLYLPLTSPHTPLSVNEEWKGKSGLGLYADFVMETDAVVGGVLEALKKSGQAGETLVVFTSDNGCAPYIGVDALEEKGHFPSGPLRGYKADAWEGGHRVPFIVRWPGVVKAGSECGHLVHQADLMATFAGILGISLPETAGEDSFDLQPLLKGGDQPVREHAVSSSVRGVPAVRLHDWKFIPERGSGGWGKGGDQSQPVQLYDLTNDAGEEKNLAAKNPKQVEAMRKLLAKLEKDGRSSPAPAEKGAGYRNPGRFEKAIQRFEEADRANPPPKGAVLAIGSSSIRMWHETIANDLAPLTVIPRGFGGSNMNDLLHYADRAVLPYQPRAIVVYEGDNDIGQGVSPERVAATMRRFVEKVHGALPGCRIYFLAIKPSLSRWKLWPQIVEANRLMAAECGRSAKLTFVDIASPMLNESGRPRPELFVKDGLHMNREGYVIWRDVLKPVLMKTERAHEDSQQAVSSGKNQRR